MSKLSWFFVPVLVWVSSCSSAPPPNPAPEWTRQASRIVDNGYIVYVGKAESSRADDAQFKSEGLALEDLANECSIVPKGTRIEDRYIEQTKSGSAAYTKIGLEFTQCDESMKAVEPDLIRKLANVAFTEQLKKYQDLEETGFRDDEPGEEIVPPTQIAAAPEQGSMSPTVHFYMTRQYIAYQKEIVVLSPATTYVVGSREDVAFRQAVVPATTQVQGMIQKDPGLRTAPVAWSHLQDRPRVVRPTSLQPSAARLAQTHERRISPRQRATEGQARPAREGAHGGEGKKKKRKRWR